MWRRGADSDGYVANFVESEQIVKLNGFTASFVQVRGSIPFLWEQVVDLTYKPKFQIVKPEEAVSIIHNILLSYICILQHSTFFFFFLITTFYFEKEIKVGCYNTQKTYEKSCI